MDDPGCCSPLPRTAEEWRALPPVTRATIYAALQHRDQRRKFIEGPSEYLTHPLAMAGVLLTEGASEAAVVSAVLHDTVEDTAATADEIGALFGEQVRGFVEELTSPKFENKEERIDYYREKMPRLSPIALQVKMTDRWHNLSQSANAPAEFVDRYYREARVMIDAVPEARREDPIVAEMIQRIVGIIGDA